MTRPIWVWNWGLIFSRLQSRRCRRPKSHLRWRNRNVLGETLEQRQLFAVDFCEPAIVAASIQTNGTSNDASSFHAGVTDIDATSALSGIGSMTNIGASFIVTTSLPVVSNVAVPNNPLITGNVNPIPTPVVTSSASTTHVSFSESPSTSASPTPEFSSPSMSPSPSPSGGSTSVSVSIGNASVTEGGGSASFPITLSGSSSATVSVDYSTGDGSATSSSDYSGSSGSVSFSAGETTQWISVGITDDNIQETVESFYVTLTSASGATISGSQGVGTITDNDSSVSSSSVSVSIGNASATEGGGPASFSITLSGSSSTSVSVNYNTIDGTATRRHAAFNREMPISISLKRWKRSLQAKLLHHYCQPNQQPLSLRHSSFTSP